MPMYVISALIQYHAVYVRQDAQRLLGWTSDSLHRKSTLSNTVTRARTLMTVYRRRGKEGWDRKSAVVVAIQCCQRQQPQCQRRRRSIVTEVDGRYVGFTLMWERSICGFRAGEAWCAQRAGFVVRGTKGAITSKIKHAIKLKTSPARLTHLWHNCCSPH